MTTREGLVQELEVLRASWKAAEEFHDEEAKTKLKTRADEIKTLLGNMCYQCKEELRQFNDYYCSQECNDLYYRPKERGVKHSIEYMQRKLREFGRESKIK